MVEPTPWRTIDELARLVGHYGWVEHRVFEVTGLWAGMPAADEAGAEVRVWCAAVSRRHAELARSWAERLPVRAGVDAAALVSPPPGPLAAAFDTLASVEDPGWGTGVLAGTVLGGLEGLYARHLEHASPVTEAAVAEVLVAAGLALAGERADAAALAGLTQGMQPADDTGRSLGAMFERAFGEMGVFPAVRPS